MIKINQLFKQGNNTYKVVSLCDSTYILVRNLSYGCCDDMGKPRKMTRSYFLKMVEDQGFILQ